MLGWSPGAPMSVGRWRPVLHGVYVSLAYIDMLVPVFHKRKNSGCSCIEAASCVTSMPGLPPAHDDAYHARNAWCLPPGPADVLTVATEPPFTRTLAEYATADGAAGDDMLTLAFSTTTSTKAWLLENAWMSMTASSVACEPTGT